MLLLLGLLLPSISNGQQSCTLVWLMSIWGRMPFLTPSSFAWNWTPDLLFRDPCLYSLRHGHGSLPQNTLLTQVLTAQISHNVMWPQNFMPTLCVERLTKLNFKRLLVLIVWWHRIIVQSWAQYYNDGCTNFCGCIIEWQKATVSIIE